MRSVTVAELKEQLSKYLAFAKGGEEIVIRDRSLPVAKLVPFSAEEASEEELLLVASGKMRMPKEPLKVEELLKIRTGRVSGNEAVHALLDRRDASPPAAGTPPVAVRSRRSSRPCLRGVPQTGSGRPRYAGLVLAVRRRLPPLVPRARCPHERPPSRASRHHARGRSRSAPASTSRST